MYHHLSTFFLTVLFSEHEAKRSLERGITLFTLSVSFISLMRVKPTLNTFHALINLSELPDSNLLPFKAQREVTLLSCAFSLCIYLFHLLSFTLYEDIDILPSPPPLAILLSSVSIINIHQKKYLTLHFLLFLYSFYLLYCLCFFLFVCVSTLTIDTSFPMRILLMGVNPSLIISFISSFVIVR